VEQADRHALDRYKDVRDQATENIFLGVYGSPVLQALVGLNTDGGKPRRIGRDIAREAAINANRAAMAAPKRAASPRASSAPCCTSSAARR
jgi:hypothetical protein